MRVVKNLPRDGQQVLEPLSTEQILARVARPGKEGLIYPHDRAVRGGREVAAGRVFIELFNGLFEDVPGGFHQARGRQEARNVLMAATVSAGALRCGQCPATSNTTSSLPGRFLCTNWPTHMGAMTSWRHCRMRDRTRTLARSARLSERKVTRANCLATSG